jgi:hypothetical protein
MVVSEAPSGGYTGPRYMGPPLLTRAMLLQWLNEQIAPEHCERLEDMQFGRNFAALIEHFLPGSFPPERLVTDTNEELVFAAYRIATVQLQIEPLVDVEDMLTRSLDDLSLRTFFHLFSLIGVDGPEPVDDGNDGDLSEDVNEGADVEDISEGEPAEEPAASSHAELVLAEYDDGDHSVVYESNSEDSFDEVALDEILFGPSVPPEPNPIARPPLAPDSWVTKEFEQLIDPLFPFYCAFVERKQPTHLFIPVHPERKRLVPQQAIVTRFLELREVSPVDSSTRQVIDLRAFDYCGTCQKRSRFDRRYRILGSRPDDTCGVDFLFHVFKGSKRFVFGDASWVMPRGGDKWTLMLRRFPFRAPDSHVRLAFSMEGMRGTPLPPTEVCMDPSGTRLSLQLQSDGELKIGFGLALTVLFDGRHSCRAGLTYADGIYYVDLPHFDDYVLFDPDLSVS